MLPHVGNSLKKTIINIIWKDQALFWFLQAIGLGNFPSWVWLKAHETLWGFCNWFLWVFLFGRLFTLFIKQLFGSPVTHYSESPHRELSTRAICSGIKKKKEKEDTTNHSPFSRESFAFSNHKSFFHLWAFDDSMGHEDTVVEKEILEYISNTLKLCGFKMYLQTWGWSKSPVLSVMVLLNHPGSTRSMWTAHLWALAPP